MSEGRWRLAGASVIGTSHEKTGSPCQDSHEARVFNAADVPILAIAVSDGAGSASQSEIGSRLACTTIMERIELFLSQGRSVDSMTDGDARAWLDEVRDAIRDRAEEHGLTLRDYACTLLVAIIGPQEAAFIQIGDGAMVVADEAGEWCWIFWPSRGEFANTTYFVTDDNAHTSISFEVGRRSISEIAAFSDGVEPLVLHYATRSVHAPFFDRVFVPVRASDEAVPDLGLSQELEKYLSSQAITERTDDDKTLILATRKWTLSTTAETLADG